MFVPKTERDHRFMYYYKLSGERCFKVFFSKLYQFTTLYDKDNTAKLPKWAVQAIEELYPENLK